MRKLVLSIALSVGAGGAAQAKIDEHGPDAWRVVGVAADDELNRPGFTGDRLV